MDIDDLITDYMDSKKINLRSYQRLNNKKYLLNDFKEYLGYKNLDEVRLKDALEYQGWILDRGKFKDLEYSPSTVNEYMITISNFYDYLIDRNMVITNPFKSIKRLRIQKGIPRNILSEKETDKLLAYFRNWNSETNLKKRASLYKMHVITELMYSTGLRIREVANLKIDDLNLFTGTLLVKEGKGGFNRTVILNSYTKNILNYYIDTMRDLIFTKRNRVNEELFFGLKFDYFEKYVNENLFKATTNLGITNITSHGFRHALGYHLLRSGCDIRHIQEILGHKRLRNTEIYTKVDKEDLKKVLNKYHPRVFKRIRDEVNSK